MIGWINKSIEQFITETFGEEKWLQILAESGITDVGWVSSCPYADKVTYDLVTTAARVLGVTVEQALEAYGIYFVRFISTQGYSKLLSALGSNVVEFLSNLNSLHLHLSSTFPSMRAPAFRCDKVTPESLELHYYSSRPGLWPIVIGVLKGVAKEFFKFQMNIELLKARGEEGMDHEVFSVTYPFQPSLAPIAMSEESRMLRGLYSLPPEDFHALHPFHILIDSSGNVIKCGDVLRRLFPSMRKGQPMVDYFLISHPFISGYSIEAVRAELHTSFLLKSTQPPSITLKGQMILTSCVAEGRGNVGNTVNAMLFMGTPRCANLDELQAAKVFLSDFQLHDMGRDFILLAEQRQAEADLKERLEKLTLEMKEEKARSDALVQRMSVLLACFPFAEKGSGHGKTAMDTAVSPTASAAGPDIDHVEVIEAVRRAMNPQLSQRDSPVDDIVMVKPISEGTYGKVYQGLWQGTEVAIKMMILPANMSGTEKREKMAIMEAAISSSLSHPNIIQTYTYTIRPVRDTATGPSLEQRKKEDLFAMGIKVGGSRGHDMHTLGMESMAETQTFLETSSSVSTPGSIHSYEVRLVLELCDMGSLRDGLDQGIFILNDDSLNYHAVLDLAMDVAKAMLHLHRQSILHSDLKSRNVMLKSSGDGRAVIAKVGDFGLSVKMDSNDTHMSNMFQGTLTHMSPEVMMEGRLSKAADVYAFGILMWEIYTGGNPFQGLPRALLGHQVTVQDRRPVFPADVPPQFKGLAEWCWSKDPDDRPSFVEIMAALKQLRTSLGGQTPSIRRAGASPCENPDAESDPSQPAQPKQANSKCMGVPHAGAATRLLVDVPQHLRSPGGSSSAVSGGTSQANSRGQSVLPASKPQKGGEVQDVYGSAILAETIVDEYTL